MDSLTVDVSAVSVSREVPRFTRRGKVCCGCRGPRDRGRYQAYCRACHNEYARATRPKHAELTDDEKRRANCRSYTNVMIRRGKIARTPCVCGSTENVQARQRGDYSNPFDVEFICKACRTGKRLATVAA